MMECKNVGSVSGVAIESAGGCEAPSTAEAPPLMPQSSTAELMASGDIGAMISAMLLEAGGHSRDIARKSKEAALDAEEAACSKKIHEMENSAENKLAGGLASAFGSGLAGGASIASALRPNTNQAFFKGGGEAADALGKGASAYWSYQSDQANLEVEKAEREMTQARRGIESASENEKDARDLLRRALDHYKDFVNAKNAAAQAALFRA
jgi:hypothetical protein